MKSTYVIQLDSKARCPSCDGEVDLLCQEAPGVRLGAWFYICWACKKVAQVGKGEVRRERT